MKHFVSYFQLSTWVSFVKFIDDDDCFFPQGQITAEDLTKGSTDSLSTETQPTTIGFTKKEQVNLSAGSNSVSNVSKYTRVSSKERKGKNAEKQIFYISDQSEKYELGFHFNLKKPSM